MGKRDLKVIRLGVMMFMQYFILAVWWVPMATYLAHTLKLEVYQVSLILSAMAVGSIASPFVGVIADRYMASERVLAALNLLAAAFLFLATMQTGFIGLFLSVMLAMLCYMPTWSLTSSIAMHHLPSSQFPRIRMLGSIGWVASGIFSFIGVFFFHLEVFDGTVLPLYCGIGASLLAAGLNLLLPGTPPFSDKTQKLSAKDILGLSVIPMLKERNYFVFMLISFLSIIPFNLYYLYGSMFLADMNVKHITITMNWGQFAEMFFLVITTTILIKCGIKKTMIFGLIAMLVRYVAFLCGVEFDSQVSYLTGILLHGLIFGLFFVGGQVYTANSAPESMKAQAQGFLSFVVWGVGFLIATLLNGYLIDTFRLHDKCDWSMLFIISSAFTGILLLLLIFFFQDSHSQKLSKT